MKLHRDVMVESIAKEVPDATVRAPNGGYFLWAELPPEVSGDELATKAVEHESLSACEQIAAMLEDMELDSITEAEEELESANRSLAKLKAAGTPEDAAPLLQKLVESTDAYCQTLNCGNLLIYR